MSKRVFVLTDDISPTTKLVTCSLCLSVLHENEWIGVEQTIRALRTYERDQPPRLDPGLCDDCRIVLDARRRPPAVTLAA
jgi:hypothetical protein